LRINIVLIEARYGRSEEVKLMTEIEPSEVVVHGAEVWARMTEERPEDFATYDGNMLVPEDKWLVLEEARRARQGGEHKDL
jgi:hypothetical protein